MMQFIRMMGGILLAVLLTACGGGGGSAGSTAGVNTGTTPGGGTPTLSVTDFALFTDKTTINNSGSDKAQLTVVALDANRNVVSGVTVSVAANQNSVFTPSGGSVTDSAGTYVGSVSIGSDKTDRDITLAVTINGVTKQTAVRVGGSRLTLQAVPPSPTPGQIVALTVALVDSSGNPIPNVSVKLGGTVPALQNQTIVTNSSGSASKSFAAPAASGVYTITASGNGVSAAEYQLQVFSSAIPAAVIPAGAVPSLSASPNVLAINSPGSTINKSVLRFLFLDSFNQPIQNVRVRFDDTTTGLAAVNASISSGTSTLYTDTSGSVTAQYISGQNSSPTNGVTVKACYSSNDFASNTCPASVTTSLTVAGQALAVSIGDDNLLEKGSGTYIKRFAVTVADSAGRAVSNAPVDISVDLTHYGKGSFDYFYQADGTAVFPLSVVPQDLTAAYPSDTTNPSDLGQRVWCANEDMNRNGNVDPLENINGSVDSNGQATLEPRKSDLLVSYADPTVTSTNANGILVIKVEYSQRFATWLAYKVRVTANVSGSQGMAERLFVTNYVEGDEKNGSFLEPPYGFSSCRSPT
jgi:hypothetical protein